MTTRGGLTGLALLGAAAAVALLDVVHLPPLLQAWLIPMLGENATDYALVETLFVLAIFGVMLVAALIGGAIERRNPLAAGDDAPRMAAIGLVIGAGGVSAAAGYAAIAGSLVPGPAPSAIAGMIAWGMGLVAIQTGAEEIFFRGWLQPALVRRWGAVAGILATTALFAALHIAGGAVAPVSLLNLFLGGLVFGLFAWAGRGLAAAATMHFGWNATEQLVWGLDPNPGVGSFGAIFDRELVGRSIWGGSGEGLNASIGMTFVLVAILLPLLALAWHRRTTTATPRVRVV